MNLKEMAKQVRLDLVDCIGTLGVGHIGGSLSIVEVLVALYFKHMKLWKLWHGTDAETNQWKLIEIYIHIIMSVKATMGQEIFKIKLLKNRFYIWLLW